MKYLYSLILLLTFNEIAFAQKSKVEGVVFLRSDSSSAVGASISIQSLSQKVLARGTSNDKGYFSIEVDGKEADMLSISYIATDTLYVRLQGLNGGRLNLGALYLSETDKQLDAVVIHGRLRHIDKQIIFPKQHQLQTSIDLPALLKQMNLNGLSIHPTERTASIHGKPVQWLVNGVARTASDVQGLEPKDILRVEYSDVPAQRYLDQGIGGTINIILRKRESGGNLRASLASALWIGYANGNLSARHSQGNSDWGLSYQGRYRYYDDWRRDQTQIFIGRMEADIERLEEGANSSLGLLTQDINLSYTCQPQPHTQLGATLRNSIGSNHNDIQSFVNESSKGRYYRSSRSEYTGYVPALDLYYQREIGKQGKLELNLLGTLIIGRGERDLSDQQGERNIGTQHNPYRNRYRSLLGEVVYTRPLFPKVFLNLGLQHKIAQTHNIYYDPSIIEDKLYERNTYGYAQFSGRLSSRWQYSLGMGLKFFHSHNDFAEQTFNKLQASLNLFYSPSNNLDISLNSTLRPSLPSLSQLSLIEQRYDDYIVYRGNPQLYPSNSYDNRLMLSHQLNHFEHNIILSYNYTDAPIFTQISYRDTTKDWIFATANGNYTQSIGAAWSLSYNPIPQKLNLYGTIGYIHYHSHIEGNQHRVGSLYGELAAQLILGRWSFALQANYTPPSLYAQVKTEYKPQLSASVVWQNVRSWRLYAQIDYIGSNYGDYYRRTNLSSIIPSSSVVKVLDNRNMLSLGAIWNFNYGKQIQRSRRQTNNQDGSASIVKVQD